MDYIKQLVREIINLSRRGRAGLIKEVMNKMDEEEKEEFFNDICKIYLKYKKTGNKDKIDEWMEDVFEKDINQTPKKVAQMGIYYFKVSKRLEPYFLKKAQKMKRRVLMRKRRKNLKKDKMS